MCHFGCGGTFTKNSMVQHYLNVHDEQQLKDWCIYASKLRSIFLKTDTFQLEIKMSVIDPEQVHDARQLVDNIIDDSLLFQE